MTEPTPKHQLARAVDAALDRRRFLTGAASGGLLLGLPPLLAACGGGDDATPVAAPPAAPAPVVGSTEPREVRTLFFNLSHVTASDGKHVLAVHGQRLPLTPVAEAPAVLAAARVGNAFLRAVPDDQITHHVENVPLAVKICPLVFVSCDENPVTGTWSMSMMAQVLPVQSAAAGYALLRTTTPTGALPLSAKRAFYGLPAAMTSLDLEEEHALVDASDHARTLIGLTPDLLCAEPAGAHYISVQHIGPASALTATINRLGKATPADNAGWATLRQIKDPSGKPYSNAQGLFQYTPDWHPDVDVQVAHQVALSTSTAKDDPALGRDVTDVLPPADAPDTSFAGSVWQRRDGQAAVRHGPTAAADSGAFSYAFGTQSNQFGLCVYDLAVKTLDDQRVQISVNFTNWFLRFLGVYAQFFDTNGDPIPVAALATDTFPGRTNASASLDKTNSAFLGVLPPAYTVAGIPVYGGIINQTVVLPLKASKMTFQLAGVGFNGAWNDPDELTLVGGLLTGLVNWALVALAMAIGVSTVDALIKAASTAAASCINEIVAAGGAGLSFKAQPTAASIAAWCGKLLQFILAAGTGTAVKALVEVIAPQLAAAGVIAMVPAAGQIARGVAAVIGGVSLLETTVEVGISPPLYGFDLTLTHTVAFTIRPDKNNSRFPDVPNGYVLYYIVSLTLDSGIPHVLDPVDIPDAAVAGIPVAIPNVNRGGQITVSIGIYARATGAAPSAGNDWLAGKATAGPFANLDNASLGDIAIDQVKIDITAKTVYLHTRRTQLDANGKHVWVATNAPPAVQALSSSSTPGALQFLRGITVRQGTSQPPQAGYVGYAWRAYSQGLLDCASKSPGQLDQVASLNTDPDHAETGRLVSSCGLQGDANGGVAIAYSLLGERTNVYLDSTTGHLRTVDLGPAPVISPSGGGTSLGVLQLDSTQLLLHPSGHVVSLNNEYSKFEALRLPSAPVDDDTAARTLKALTMSGQGSRPGLMLQPIAAAIAADGTILVLEDSNGNNRIQAFDLTGNPLPYFAKQKNAYFLQLDATADSTYLDLAVEFSGFLYVLSQSADADQTIRLDIYHPGQVGTQPVCSTIGLNAGRIAVDYWRSLYALNYEVLTVNGSVPALTEPSVSLWLPPFSA